MNAARELLEAAKQGQDPHLLKQLHERVRPSDGTAAQGAPQSRRRMTPKETGEPSA